MRKFIVAVLLLAATNSHALDISGVRLDESIQLGSQYLVLNGAGIRSKFVVKVYVVALYLNNKSDSADAILADKGSKRISLVMLRDVGSKLFFDGLNASILANHSTEEMTLLDPKVDKLLKFILTIPELKKGEVLNLDYAPGVGTKILINGVERGIVEGDDFYPALLKIWIGHKPVNRALKHALLGEEAERN